MQGQTTAGADRAYIVTWTPRSRAAACMDKAFTDITTYVRANWLSEKVSFDFVIAGAQFTRPVASLSFSSRTRSASP